MFNNYCSIYYKGVKMKEDKYCNECNNEDENAVLFWNCGVICEDELTHKNTKDYTCLCEDCKYELEKEGK